MRSSPFASRSVTRHYVRGAVGLLALLAGIVGVVVGLAGLTAWIWDRGSLGFLAGLGSSEDDRPDRGVVPEKKPAQTQEPVKGNAVPVGQNVFLEVLPNGASERNNAFGEEWKSRNHANFLQKKTDLCIFIKIK